MKRLTCKGDPESGPCTNNIDPNTDFGKVGVCSQRCYASLFTPKFVRIPEVPPIPGQKATFLCKDCGSTEHGQGAALCPKGKQGSRYNEGKPRVDLIPAVVLLELGKHYTYGANKYAPNNWVKGFPYSETSASLLRHLYAWLDGERDDPESGHHHLIAVIWNAVTLFYFELFPEKYKQFDDRIGVWAESDVKDPQPCMLCGGTYAHFDWCASLKQPGIPPTVPIPEGQMLMRTGERIPQHAMYLNENKEWETVPNGWVTTHYDKSMGPITIPFHSESFKIPATEIRK